MPRDNRKIESVAVNTVSAAFNCTDNIVPYFDFSDKNPATDGYIEVYRNTKLAKKNICGRIGVQIKGKSAPSKSEGHVKHSVSIDDLRFYFENEDGIIFFVVCGTDTDNPSIFYKELSPYDLKIILDDLETTNKSSKSIKFKPFPRSSRDIDRICLDFLRDRDKQKSLKTVGIKSIEELKAAGIPITQLSLTKTTYSDEYPLSLKAFQNGAFFYAKNSIGESYVIEKIEDIFAISASTKKLITSGSVSFEATVTVKETHAGTEVHFPGFNIELFGQNKIRFTNDGGYRKKLQNVSLMREIIRTQTLSIDGLVLFRGLRNLSDSFDHLDDCFREYSSCVAIMDILSVKIDWDPAEFNDDDLWKLNLLYCAFIADKPVKLKQEVQPICNIDICGSRVNLGFTKIDACSYEVQDILNPNYDDISLSVEENGEEKLYKIPPLLLFDRDDYRTAANLDEKRFFDSIKATNLCKNTEDFACRKLLEMIIAWDDGALCEDELYACCLVLANELIRLNPDNVNYQINLLQIIKRKREMSNGEIDYLESIAINPDYASDHSLLTSVNILLNNFSLAKKHLALLSGPMLEEFEAWPIYRLMEQSLA